MKSYFRLARGLLALALFSGSVLAQAPLNPDVGDVDSFGHSVIYLGAAQTITVQVLDPCAPQDPTRIRCTNLLPVISWILEWGPHARVTAPPTLIEHVIRELEAARAQY